MMSHEENCGMGYEESCDQRAAFEEFIANLARGLEGEGFNVRRVNLDDLRKNSHQPSPFSKAAMGQAPINKQEGQEGDARPKWSIADLLMHEAQCRGNGQVGKYRREAGAIVLISVVLARPGLGWAPVIQDIVKTQYVVTHGESDVVCWSVPDAADERVAAVRFTIDGETKKIKDVTLVRDDKS